MRHPLASDLAAIRLTAALATTAAWSLVALAHAEPPDVPLDVARAADAAQVPQNAASVCAIQGSGRSSPLAGRDEAVTTHGVVIASFLGDAVAASERGFFIQHDACDANPATSDGLFVFVPSAVAATVAVSVGQAVTVTGHISEYYGLTQIRLAASSDLTATTPSRPIATGLPSPAPLDPPTAPSAAAAYLEAREGMRVALLPSFVVAATNAHGVAYAMPAAAGIPRVFRGTDDGRLLGLAAPGHWLALDHAAGLNATVGALSYLYGQFRLLLAQDDVPPYAPIASGPMPAGAAPSGTLGIATYNLHDYFDAVDDPATGDTVLTHDQLTVQTDRRARSIAAFVGAPAIVGVQEVENAAVLRALAAHPLLADAGYDVLLEEGPDARGIDVGFLYQRDRVRLVQATGSRQAQACTTDPQLVPLLRVACTHQDSTPGRYLFDRPPLVARFDVVAPGSGTGPSSRLTVINNHFRSMSGDDDTTPVRVAMAEHVRALVERERAADPGARVVVLGDLNAFEDSAPLAALTTAGMLTNVHARIPDGADYTYIFNGVSQILDHILVPPDQPVTDVRIVHANTDFAAPPGRVEHQSPRVSDHDPMLLFMPLDGAPAASRCALRCTVYLPRASLGWPVMELERTSHRRTTLRTMYGEGGISPCPALPLCTERCQTRSARSSACRCSSRSISAVPQHKPARPWPSTSHPCSRSASRGTLQ